GRIRLAVPRHVEGDHAIVRRDRLVAHQVAELAPVGAGGVQADQRDALPRLLEVHAAGLAEDLHGQVAPDDRLERGAVHGVASRGIDSRSLKYCRLAMNGWRFPSIRNSPRLVSAKRSCQPVSGSWSNSAALALAEPRSAK